ncbi:unnamed protein product [Rhizoctonia solani]|uniref:L-2-hydroxyglutarate dehydrogenase, mitochondrial n=1 Tax=Rhizoctonia solani TaxID=456999 RepID=A0A8H2XFM2_9AGAM|nr:unnamed protein product [Rhizoctonia solani]
MQKRNFLAVIAGLTIAKKPEMAVDHLIIGAGAIGLAIAQRLSYKFPNRSTYLVERNDRVGEETSPNSSKSPVAPTRFISGDEARELEPDLSHEITAAIESPETGILDSHSFFESLEKLIDESNGAGVIALGTKVVRVDPYVPEPGESIDGSTSGWAVQFVTGDSDEPDSILARTLINASGLSSTLVLNALLPPEKRLAAFFSRGSYASYRGPGTSSINRLIYPVPEQGRSHGHASLGTHLTVDMEGNIKFGPDAEWLQPPEDPALDGQEIHDFWKQHLVPSDSRLDQMYQAVLTYLPGIHRDGLSSDYVGIRPKLVGQGHGFQDFIIRPDWSTDFYRAQTDTGSGRMISLMGIESPGLTSSLAIAEMIVEELI